MSTASISGDAVLGATLTVSYTLSGGDTSVLSYGWATYDAPSGGSPIDEFSSGTQTLVIEPDGASISDESHILGYYIGAFVEFDVSGVVATNRIGPITASAAASSYGTRHHRRRFRIRRDLDEEEAANERA